MSKIKLAPEKDAREFHVLFPGSIANRIIETAEKNAMTNADVIRHFCAKGMNTDVRVRTYKRRKERKEFEPARPLE